MTVEDLLINVGYALTLVGLLMRDILWLRVSLILGQGLLGVYGVHESNPSMAAWNFTFVAINVVRAIRLLLERRPIHLPRELETLYRQSFLMMKRRDFLCLWEMGAVREANGTTVIRSGERQSDLILLIEGDMSVRKDGREVARLVRGSFAAEMSFVSGEPASADVVADGRIRYVAWPQEKLRSLQQINPDLHSRLQAILARDLAHKVKAASAR